MLEILNHRAANKASGSNAFWNTAVSSCSEFDVRL